MIFPFNIFSITNDSIFICRMEHFPGLEDFYEEKHRAPQIASGEVSINNIPFFYDRIYFFFFDFSLYR